MSYTIFFFGWAIFLLYLIEVQDRVCTCLGVCLQQGGVQISTRNLDKLHHDESVALVVSSCVSDF